jgi:hypothetical protein
MPAAPVPPPADPAPAPPPPPPPCAKAKPVGDSARSATVVVRIIDLRIMTYFQSGSLLNPREPRRFLPRCHPQFGDSLDLRRHQKGSPGHHFKVFVTPEAADKCFDENDPEAFRAACQFGLEGIVSKRLDRRYRAGRSPDWVKVKNPASPAMHRVKEAFA